MGALGAGPSLGLSCRAVAGGSLRDFQPGTFTFGGISCRAMHTRTLATSSSTTVILRPISCRTTSLLKCRIGSSTTTAGGSAGCFASFRRRRPSFTSSTCAWRHVAHACLFRSARQDSRSQTRCRFPTRRSTSNRARHIAQGLVAIGSSSEPLSPGYAVCRPPPLPRGGPTFTGRGGSVLASVEGPQGRCLRRLPRARLSSSLNLRAGAPDHASPTPDGSFDFGNLDGGNRPATRR